LIFERKKKAAKVLKKQVSWNLMQVQNFKGRCYMKTLPIWEGFPYTITLSKKMDWLH